MLNKMGRSLLTQLPAPAPNLYWRSETVSIFLHCTPRVNVKSILRGGIDPAYSRTQWSVCWFCAPCRRAWAIAHVADRHGVSPAEVAVLRVAIPRAWLTHRGRASWTCPRVVRDIVAVSLPCAA